MRFAHGDDVWEIEQRGSELAITDRGARTTKKFVTPEHAGTRMAQLIADKRAAGFVEAAAPPVVVPPPAPAPPPPPPVPRNRELEAAIAAAPDDVAAYAVYGDWLEHAGDPRGTLIALALACERKPRDSELAARYARHFDKHTDHFLGRLLGAPTWKRGFITALQLGDCAVADALQVALAHPSCALITELDLSGARPPIPGDLAAALRVVGARAPRTLRTLHVRSRDDVGELSALYHLPLRWLALRVRHELDPVVSPATLASVARAPWPLQRLELHLGPDPSFDALEALLARRDLPELTHLRLRTVVDFERASAALPITRRIVRALFDSPLAPQLRVLEIAMGRATDAVEPAEWFAVKSRFASLRELWIDANPARLAGFAPHVVPPHANVQYGVAHSDDDDDDDDDRYDDAGE